MCTRTNTYVCASKPTHTNAHIHLQELLDQKKHSLWVPICFPDKPGQRRVTRSNCALRVSLRFVHNQVARLEVIKAKLAKDLADSQRGVPAHFRAKCSAPPRLSNSPAAGTVACFQNTNGASMNDGGSTQRMLSATQRQPTKRRQEALRNDGVAEQQVG